VHSHNGVKQTLLTMPLPPATSLSTERACIGESQASVTVSFDTIYDRHVVFVWRTLRAFGVTGNALEDAVQDVFLVVHRNLASFDGRAKVTTWLFGIARRVAAKYRRARAPSDELPVIEERLHDPRPTPFDEAALAEAKAFLERILDLLDDKQRICFTLMEFEQMTAEEVASLLGINVNTVYSRSRRARIEFDRLVERYGNNL
jgi:RNA polymerase sigma-70 factor, ECF subfamily